MNIIDSNRIPAHWILIPALFLYHQYTCIYIFIYQGDFERERERERERKLIWQNCGKQRWDQATIHSCLWWCEKDIEMRTWGDWPCDRRHRLCLCSIGEGEWDVEGMRNEQSVGVRERPKWGGGTKREGMGKHGASSRIISMKIVLLGEIFGCKYLSFLISWESGDYNSATMGFNFKANWSNFLSVVGLSSFWTIGVKFVWAAILVCSVDPLNIKPPTRPE